MRNAKQIGSKLKLSAATATVLYLSLLYINPIFKYENANAREFVFTLTLQYYNDIFIVFSIWNFCSNKN